MYEYIVAGVLVIFTYLFWKKSRPSKLPPGPICLPVIGNLHNVSFDSNFTSKMQNLHKKHGPIISLSFIGLNIWDVWIDSYEMIREVLHDSRFANRTIFGLFEFLGNGYGVAFSSGEVSRAKRRLVLTTLRHFGVGKTVFAQGIEQQIEMMLQHIETKRRENRPLYLQGVMAMTTNNVIMKLLFDISNEFDDPNFVQAHLRLNRVFYLFNPTLLIWLLPYWISRHMAQTKELKELRFGFINEMKEFFEARKPKDEKEFLTEEPICVADYIWRDLMQYKNEAYPFPEHDIPFILTDMFMAGQETTTMTLSWAIMHMMYHPDIQDKIYEELKAEFPDKSQIIPLSGLNTCDFTRATIQEVQRVTPVLFSTIDHTASETVEDFHGFRIPKGTRMMPNLSPMYHNPKLWKFPDDFNPKNFLDDEGKFEKNMYLMPFSVGTRACPGENIAKMELFLVFANILRRYKVTPAGGKLPNMAPHVGFVNEPEYYEVNVEPRD